MNSPSDRSSDRHLILYCSPEIVFQIEAGSINKTKHRVLDYVGGGVSLEMQMPKLLWLKNHRPDVWQRASKYFDLPDWLVYRATQTDVRSLCSVVCKVR